MLTLKMVAESQDERSERPRKRQGFIRELDEEGPDPHKHLGTGLSSGKRRHEVLLSSLLDFTTALKVVLMSPWCVKLGTKRPFVGNERITDFSAWRNTISMLLTDIYPTQITLCTNWAKLSIILYSNRCPCLHFLSTEERIDTS